MTPRDILDLWPSAGDLAADLGLKNGSHVRTMKTRGRIPRAYWHDMAAAAKKRKMVGVTIDAIRAAHRDASISPEAA